MIDILEELINNKISIDEAYDIFDEVVDKYHDGEINNIPSEELKLDKYEWNAICHGINMQVLGEWRRSGWPQKCNSCGTYINYKEDSWIIKNNKLIGIDCCENINK